MKSDINNFIFIAILINRIIILINVFPTHTHHPCSPISGSFVGDPSVYSWMSVGPVSSMAASVAANCWSLDIDLETSVIAVELVVDGSKVGQVWEVSDPPDGTSVGPILTGPQEQWCSIEGQARLLAPAYYLVDFGLHSQGDVFFLTAAAG